MLRYTPNLVRDEWVNIGILLFNPATGERRLRLVEDEEEYRRVRRLHPHADEPLLRALQVAPLAAIVAVLAPEIFMIHSISTLHGRHHVAQTLIITTWPR